MHQRYGWERDELMCGISGMAPVDPNRLLPLERVREMTLSLQHRGPDAHGELILPGVGLGHERLAIIDLEARSDQPFSSPDGRLHLVFNGEIYNYKRLRVELASSWRFRTGSDTEVLLASWSRWGKECVSRLSGMFAFAVWDAWERSLFLVRDRFGIKPLYTAVHEGCLYFASEIGALLAAGVPAEPDTLMVGRFLAQGGMEGVDGRTFFAHISEVPAAHVLQYRAGQLRGHRYWEPRLIADEATGAGLIELLEASVRAHLQADVPVGSCLSGGLDSSTIASMVRLTRDSPDRQIVVHAASSHRSLDESHYARTVASRLGIEMHEVVPTGEGLLEDLYDLVRRQEQPFATTGVYAQYCVMREAAAVGLRVMQDGQGADEVLGGYAHHRIALAGELLGRGRIRQARGVLAGPGVSGGRFSTVVATLPFSKRQREFLRRLHKGDTAQSLAGPSLETVSKRGPISPENGNDRSFRGSRLYDVVAGSLPPLLRYEDRNSMAFSLEARVPFLDHELVEYALALPGAELSRDGYSKYPLRAYLTRAIGADIGLRRGKLGYATPQDAWIQGPLYGFACDVFSDSLTKEAGLVDSGRALRALGTVGRGRSSDAAWRALSVSLWFAWVAKKRAGLPFRTSTLP